MIIKIIIIVDSISDQVMLMLMTIYHDNISYHDQSD